MQHCAAQGLTFIGTGTQVAKLPPKDAIVPAGL